MSNKRVVSGLESRFIWRLMEQMGYLATTPGVRELNDWKLYSELLSSSSIRPVSSNLTVIENGTERPAGVETLVAEIGGVDVGFLALMGENELSTAKPPEGIEFKVSDPLETARRIVPELRKRAELVVLMSQISPKETDQLIQEVPGIDVALYGRQAAWKDRAVEVGSTIVQQSGIRGQYLGELVLIVDPDGKIADWGSRNRSLDAKIPESPEIAAAVKKVKDEGKDLIKKNREQKSQELDSKLSSERYLGVQKCQRCHEQEHKQWLQTSHARAWASLVAEGKQEDKECVGCHVTGWEKPNGFAGASGTNNLVNVQCESCHSIGTQHTRGEKAAKVTEETCKSCHSGEWAKGFNFASYMAKVDHTAD